MVNSQEWTLVSALVQLCSSVFVLYGDDRGTAVGYHTSTYTFQYNHLTHGLLCAVSQSSSLSPDLLSPIILIKHKVPTSTLYSTPDLHKKETSHTRPSVLVHCSLSGRMSLNVPVVTFINSPSYLNQVFLCHFGSGCCPAFLNRTTCLPPIKFCNYLRVDPVKLFFGENPKQ